MDMDGQHFGKRVSARLGYEYPKQLCDLLKTWQRLMDMNGQHFGVRVSSRLGFGYPKQLCDLDKSWQNANLIWMLNDQQCALPTDIEGRSQTIHITLCKKCENKIPTKISCYTVYHSTVSKTLVLPTFHHCSHLCTSVLQTQSQGTAFWIQAFQFAVCS